MATFLEITLLEKFGALFSFLLVLVVVYGILSFTKLFGDNKVIHFMIAFLIGLFVLFSPTAVGIIQYMAPWFVVIFFFIIFLLMAYKIFGVSDENIVGAIRKGVGIQWAIFIVGLIIFLSALAANLGKAAFPYLEENNETASSINGESPSVATGDIGKNTAATLFHPKVLGMILILLVGVAAIGLIGASGKIRS